MNSKIKVGFIGAGGIAKSHVLSINSLKFYYNDAPETEFYAVSSFTEKSRNEFARRYGFKKPVSPDEFFSDEDIDSVYIFGPNQVHFGHFSRALQMPSVKRIYLEKPVCSNKDEEMKMTELAALHPHITMQTGFQYLFMTAIREALLLWKSGKLGEPLHFDLKYYHGDYLQKSYRDKRTNRLTPAPDGGAIADLGSHVISLAVAFLGNELSVSDALKSGSFGDVDPLSDLFSLITLQDKKTGAAGTISASRIASGTGDLLSVEFYCTKGALRFSTHRPEYYEYYLEETGQWIRMNTGSGYGKITSFPSGHVPPGWLRPMIHGHYVFLTGNDHDAAIPDIRHGLDVQRIVRQTAEILREKRIHEN